MSSRCTFASKRNVRLLGYVSASVLLASMIPFAAQAATVANPNPDCGGNTAEFNPGNGQGIVVPPGFNVSVFKSGLNMPTGLAFRKTGGKFEVYVLESGHGLPSRCNDESIWPGNSGPARGEPSARVIPSPPTSSSSIKMGPSNAGLASQQLRGSASRRRAPLSTSRSSVDCRAAACSRLTRTSRCERPGTTTAHAS